MKRRFALRSRLVRTAPTAVMLLVALAAGSTSASGRLEINQTVVTAAGGFPYTISSPGSYVLTGPLVVPSSTDGLVLEASDVVLDLNGFSITSNAHCDDTGCTTGSGSGVLALPGNRLVGHRVTLRNGSIQRFAGHCVALESLAHVEGLLVSECGDRGIDVDEGSVVKTNRVHRTGREGIRMHGRGSFYGENSVSSAALAGGGERALEGGSATSGNACDDQSCTPRGERRFYLTRTLHTGGQASQACDPGFHMAAVTELSDYGQRVYDLSRGYQLPDSGSGAPVGSISGAAGWARSGKSLSAAGWSCDGWTDSSSSMTGTWTTVPALNPGSNSCGHPSAVWCIED